MMSLLSGRTLSAQRLLVPSRTATSRRPVRCAPRIQAFIATSNGSPASATPYVPVSNPETTPQFLVDSKFAKLSGLSPRSVYRNLNAGQLYEHALKFEPGTSIVSSGALATTSGSKTGRSPAAKRVVKDSQTEQYIWRGPGSPNYEMDDGDFLKKRQIAINYLNSLDRVYVFDGYANWDPKNRLKIRVVTSRAYHALFMSNMLIRPTDEELKDFGEPDFVIINAGATAANVELDGTKTKDPDTCVALHPARMEMVILGTQYAGEMKKGVFTLMHYLMPHRGHLSLHSGANMGKKGDVSLFFGLSGTGKTTLSTDHHRPLIGDDEHVWTDSGVYNIEGGCYAKCIGLKPTTEPDIWEAIKFGSVLENVVVDPHTAKVDFMSAAITENTRASYPIEFIQNAHIPCEGGHPRNVVLLTCDAFGVLPPVSKLTIEQAMYHFVSGYTSKIPGTEDGIKEPTCTFSACYGAAFLMMHPAVYAHMLAEKMDKHGTHAWLINTGWVGGRAGKGPRMSLRHTRAIIDAIHSGELEKVDYVDTPYFHLQVPVKCTGVPSTVLNPAKAWSSEEEYDKEVKKLAKLFIDNFQRFHVDGPAHVSMDEMERIDRGAPTLY